MKYKKIYNPDTNSLKNKIILIIKPLKNIKNKIIKSFINCEAIIIILDKSINNLSKIYDKIQSNKKKNIYSYIINIDKATNKDFYELTKKIYINFGRIDGIIYDIPKLGKSTLFEQYNIQDLHKIMILNFYNKFIIIKSMLPLIKLSKNPSIIFITHNIKHINTYWSSYSCANSALQTLIKIIYEENKNIKTIKINQIQLQKNNTDLYKKEFPGIKKSSTNIKKLINILIYIINKKNKNLNNKTFIINKNIQIYKKTK